MDVDHLMTFYSGGTTSLADVCKRQVTLTTGVRLMCRNIKTLFNFEPPVTEDEIRAASLQFVRKVSGFNRPSKANEAAFLAAVDEIAAISRTLLNSLKTNAPPKNRTEEVSRRRPAVFRGLLSDPL